MKLFKTIILLLSFSLITTSGIAQCESCSKNPELEFLKGLQKAEQDELGKDRLIMLDGESIPVYDQKGKRFKGMELMKQLSSGEYSPDMYVNEKKVIQAIVLQKATEKEMLGMKKMMSNFPSKQKLLGEKALVFSFTDLNDQSYSLSSLKEKVIVLNFWFTDCPPCVSEIPELNQLVQKYKDQEVVFLGLALDNAVKLKIFLLKHPFAYRIIPEAKCLADAYRLPGYPTQIVIDKHSIIAYKNTGYGPQTVSDLDQRISELFDL
ncbi:TlpA family protein disulfide reductase [Marinifilum sp. D737]|uniref:TlpA family protein disulfide reductase n=1 Tax=Marinifilum sp. D737 TaxID=2969628 RepID=UPI00227616CB|nr:TlpA disulfide reductase family protein [Marinifilum sp. D737]MCY1633927.1 TlpA family protein disulfide reductase [Marinifilum sp. D737]